MYRTVAGPYLQEMGAEMDARYAQPDGRKIVYSSWNPVKLLRNANIFTLVILLVLLALVMVAVLIVLAVRKRKNQRKKT